MCVCVVGACSRTDLIKKLLDPLVLFVSISPAACLPSASINFYEERKHTAHAICTTSVPSMLCTAHIQYARWQAGRRIRECLRVRVSSLCVCVCLTTEQLLNKLQLHCVNYEYSNYISDGLCREYYWWWRYGVCTLQNQNVCLRHTHSFTGVNKHTHTTCAHNVCRHFAHLISSICVCVCACMRMVVKCIIHTDRKHANTTCGSRDYNNQTNFASQPNRRCCRTKTHTRTHASHSPNATTTTTPVIKSRMQ